MIGWILLHPQWIYGHRRFLDHHILSIDISDGVVSGFMKYYI